MIHHDPEINLNMSSQVSIAKTMPPNKALPLCRMSVSANGVSIDVTKNSNGACAWNYPIETISYGVQDLVYTRVFAMIIVEDGSKSSKSCPFYVHAFVCDSR